MQPPSNPLTPAQNSKDHTTLVAAVKAAVLVDTLEGPGPFTVFAPTNEAFAALPAGTVETLLKPENKGKLTAVLIGARASMQTALAGCNRARYGRTTGCPKPGLDLREVGHGAQKAARRRNDR